VSERRGVWVAIATVLLGGGLAAILAAIANPSAVLVITSLLLTVAGGAAFIWLLIQVSDGRSTQRPLGTDETGTDSTLVTPLADIPEIPAVFYQSAQQEMYRLGPSSWLGALSGSQPAELILRAAIALPAVTLSTYSHDIATALRGQDREQFLLETLEHSAITHWLNTLKESWHWEHESHWEVHGSGQPDLTQLIFRPQWVRASRPPLVARLGVLTGLRAQPDGQLVRAIQVALDVMLNLLELDGQRRISPLRHGTIPPPAPAALSLEELATYLAHLMEVVRIASEIGVHLLPGTPLKSGYVGAWIDPSGVELERVVDLSEVDRVGGAVSTAGFVRVSEWSLDQHDSSPPEFAFIADLLDEMLEVGGYRGVRNRFDWLREPTSEF
jgi:hypothetical protein